MKKTKEELMIIFSDVLSDKNILKASGIHEVNHKPHAFTIGPKHIKYAADNNAGVLSEEICQKIKCGHPKCNLSYTEHTSDKTLFLQLKRDTLESEVQKELIKIKDLLIENAVNGIAFADSEEKYKFLKDAENEQ
jgi:hypothetical protein